MQTPMHICIRKHRKLCLLNDCHLRKNILNPLKPTLWLEIKCDSHMNWCGCPTHISSLVQGLILPLTYLLSSECLMFSCMWSVSSFAGFDRVISVFLFMNFPATVVILSAWYNDFSSADIESRNLSQYIL